MADPNTTPSAFGDVLYEAVSPLAYDDENNDYALKTLCYAIGQQFEQLWTLAQEDDDGHLPWERIVNPVIGNSDTLPYIAQLVGVTIPEGTSDADARTLIAGATGMARGTPQSILDAAAMHLNGTNPFMNLSERDTSPYHVTLHVKSTDTDLPAGIYIINQNQTTVHSLIQAMLAVKPAGLIFALSVSGGITIDELVGTIDSQSNTIDGLV